MFTKPLTPKQVEIARDLHNHVESQATLAVMKSALLLTAHAFLCAAYIQIAVSIEMFKHQKYSTQDHLFILSGMLILTAFLVSLVSIWPKLESTYQNHLMFFAGIGKFQTADQYIAQYKSISDDSLAECLLSNIHGKSVWLRRTFWWVRASICCSAVGSLMCVIAVWWMSLAGYAQP